SALTPAEIDAALEHEKAHLAERDNLKRAVLHACRDVLAFLPSGRGLERAWAEAAESSADDSAARRGGEVAVNLAAAIVKIARMVPPASRPSLPAAALLTGIDRTGIESRVLRLLSLAPEGEPGRPALRQSVRIASRASLGGLLFATVALLSGSGLLASVHALLERIVALLQ